MKYENENIKLTKIKIKSNRKRQNKNNFYKYIFFILSIIIFIFGYSTCYFLHSFNKNKDNFNINSNPIKINKNNENNYSKQKLIEQIDKIFKKNHKVNINSIEKEIIPSYNENKNESIKNIIHIEFTLDTNFILETMFTVSSIMSTQDITTKIIFHFGVINDFSAEHMLKMYELRERINNSTEFNFYYLLGAMEKMKGFHSKGVACPGKFEVPELLPDDVERILLFDGGDVLVFRDLSELYNYDMKDYWALGTPEPFAVSSQNNNNTKFINIGSTLINVKELKKMHFWETYVNNKHLAKNSVVKDQVLFNILIPDNRKNFFPFRFGSYTQYSTNYRSDHFQFLNYGFQDWLKSDLSKSMPEKPGSIFELMTQLYNPVFIHQLDAKWMDGGGLSIYRYIAKYFIQLAGIWEELCHKRPGFCK